MDINPNLRILKIDDNARVLLRPCTMTDTEAIIVEGKTIEKSVQSPVPGNSVGSTDVMGTLSGSSSNDKKVEGGDPANVHASSSLQPPVPLTSKGEEESIATSPPKSSTAPQLKMGGDGGGFGSAIIGNAKSNAFSSLAGLHGDGKWIGNLKSDTISRGQELWGGLTKLTSSSELGNSSIDVEEKGNAASRKLLHLYCCLFFLSAKSGSCSSFV